MADVSNITKIECTLNSLDSIILTGTTKAYVTKQTRRKSQKKTEALTLPGAGVQFPIQLQQSIASTGIVHRFAEKVNMKISETVQSQQFKRWFGDWLNDPAHASKVVNADGTPLVMYHGTRAENGDFTVFDYSKAVKKGGIGLKALGKGNYFTSKPLNDSKRYGSRAISAYLDIKNPFV